jgi:menaquinone-dependent protoporphyrinogen oxidase
MSNVLVAYGSKHGATQEIARAMADELGKAGHSVECLAAESVTGLASYDAAVIGSAVYMALWRPAARRLLKRAARELSERPLWLFSSGPFGQAEPSWAAPPGIERAAKRLGARDHVVFGGRVPLEPANFVERGIARRSAPEHRDLRDRDTIRGWADEIAAQLSATGEQITTT